MYECPGRTIALLLLLMLAAALALAAALGAALTLAKFLSFIFKFSCDGQSASAIRQAILYMDGSCFSSLFVFMPSCGY